jgi:catechol 1,2-dioxygenase
MTDRRQARLVRAVALSLAALYGLTACSHSASDTADRTGLATSASGAASSPTSTVANCQPTRGEPSQGHAFGSTGALRSFARLHPGPDVTPAEAAAEAPARQGTPLIITGTVYASDCQTALAGAFIEVWQTDARGEYGPGHGTESLRCCYLLAALETDSRGQYRIETIRPGHYRGAHPPPPAHIHFNVLYPGTLGVATELDFAGDPYLAKVDARTHAISLHRKSGSDGELLRGRFDIVLASS